MQKTEDGENRYIAVFRWN